MASKISPNDPCPCWSKKKYKKCHEVDRFQNTCTLFLKENLNDNIKNIQSFIDVATNEISQAVKCLQDHCKIVQTLRSQCILLFAFIETMSKLWGSFIDYKSTDRDKECVVSRFNEFIGTNNNEAWKTNTHLHNLDWEILYKLRCKLSHGLSVPDTQINWKTIMINNDSTHPSAELLRKRIKNLIAISPTELALLAIWAGKLMIDRINYNGNDIDFPQKIQNMANYLQKEWAELITSE